MKRAASVLALIALGAFLIMLTVHDSEITFWATVTLTGLAALLHKISEWQEK